ncbi:MAG: ADP-ribosylglycohydrolase family protein [Clostridia bacterium]|nr:ADP-ribosylglycohydrolase family protein [Clostridia bacterium]
MLGAITGDLVGSRFEFKNIKSKDFEFFHPNCRLTDDSYMTFAVCKAFLDHLENGDDLDSALVTNMQNIGRKYPNAGYGNHFFRWLNSENPQPYNSYGNGSAMRVSPVVYLYDDLDEILKAAEKSAQVSHNHPEGIKGAQAIAGAAFLARQGKLKNEIKNFAKQFYNLDFTLNEIREDYRFYVTCQQSVPQAIVAFLEGNDFEDVIRNAISIGGDSDTIAAMAGTIAESFFNVNEDIENRVLSYLPDDLMKIYERYINFLNSKIS